MTTMTATLLTNHLLNFVAPAAFVALLLGVSSRLFSGASSLKRPVAHSWWAQAAIIFVVSLFTLTAGLLFFGHDGKMASYAALVLGAAFCQWVLLRGWKA
jgi:hypothetical protein